MKRPSAVLIVTAVPLILTALRVSAGELPSTSAESPPNEPARLHWSALIGSGDAARGNVSQPKITSGGKTNISPALHWTASIGTGTAAASTTTVIDTSQRPSSAAQPVIAAANWSSRIGTGHATERSFAVR